MDKEKINDLILEKDTNDVIIIAKAYEPSKFVTFFVIFWLIILFITVGYVVQTPLFFHKANASIPDISYASFTKKLNSTALQQSFNAHEIASFLDTVLQRKVLLDSKNESLFLFPDKLRVLLEKDSAYLFLPLKLLDKQLIIGMKVSINMYKKRRLRVKIERLFFGKLNILESVVTAILKFLNMDIVYPVPDFIEELYLSDSLLVMVKEQVKKPIIAKEKETKVIDGRKRQEEAEKLHMLGDYFMEKKFFDSALTHYGKISKVYPEYIEIDQINRKINQIKKYQNG